MSTTEKPLGLDLKSLTEVLIRHFDVHEGAYQLNFGFRIGVGGFAMDNTPGSTPLPGAMVGVEGVSILRVPDGLDLPNTVDAAIVNPVPKSKPKTNSKSK